MPPLKNPKHEKFCLEYFAHGNATEAAIKAGYPSDPNVAASSASRLLRNVKVSARIKQLQKKVESDKIMSVRERKERLSEIARARVTDFVACKDGKTCINVTLESANSAALTEVTTEEVTLGRGDDAPVAQITKLKLRDPVGAIAELNKMDGAYAPEKHVVTGRVEIDAKSKIESAIARIASRTREETDNTKSQPEGSGKPAL